ncbi:MAG TPA: tetratricopeptide repeat protein [Candidatus Paceibacterota bacterium]|nr:tetratricopeptide repeat protein [Candidatus Paceibacterota bacterium]
MSTQGKNDGGDRVARGFVTVAENVLVVIFGLLPIIFVPIAAAPYDYTKFSAVVLAVIVALVLFSLSVLRSGTLRIGVSYPLVAMWSAVAIAFISALLSGDFKDALVGDFFSIHSVVFLAMLALVPTVWVLLRPGREAVIRMYLLLVVSTFTIVAFHVLRMIFGPQFLSFGIFTGTVSTPLGSWNDLALFLGLIVILSLIALEQLALSRVAQWLFTIAIVASLGMLAVINFFTVWLVLGLMSLVMIVYSLRRDKFEGSQLLLVEHRATSGPALILALVVFVVSVLFVIGGATIGGYIAKTVGISYVEVRPSFQATADIARNVYHENAFLGIGPNRFEDAWRLYKDESINLTPFWNTDFNAGNGYISTLFVTTGVLGGLAWLTFLISFLVMGTRRLLSAPASDRLWYFIGVSSFVSAVYIWGMSVIYVPGVVVLLLGSLCVGVSLVALAMLEGAPARVLVVGSDRRTGFILTLVVIVVIVGSVSVLYTATRHYSSVYAFNESLLEMQNGTNIDALESRVADAYALSSSDVFARRIAEFELARMNSLITVASPTDAEQKQFQDASLSGINAAQQAILIDRFEPSNWSVLGGIYGALASVNVEGAKDKAIEAYQKYVELDPKNPLPLLELAVVEGRAGDYDKAREYVNRAITLKPDFTDAFFFLSQLEIATGNVEAAIKSTQAVVSLEPQNPVRYYQLGVLESFDKNPTAAISAFERAVALDPNYANARYLLALSYDEAGQSDKAKAELEAVAKLNPDNAEVANLITVITEEGSLKRLRAEANKLLAEPQPTLNDTGTVSTEGGTGDSSLIAPVNTAPKAETATSSGQ